MSPTGYDYAEDQQDYGSPMMAKAVDREPALDEFSRQIDRVKHLTAGLEKQLQPVLRSPHPTADSSDRPQSSSPLRNLSLALQVELDRLEYIAERIDL